MCQEIIASFHWHRYELQNKNKKKNMKQNENMMKKMRKLSTNYFAYMNKKTRRTNKII